MGVYVNHAISAAVRLHPHLFIELEHGNKNMPNRIDEPLFEEMQTNLQIDRNNLDIEMQQQSVLFYKIGDMFVQASAERDTLKDELAHTDAVLTDKHTIALEAAGKRATKDSIEAAIKQDDEHITCSENYLAAKAYADKCAALKEAFHMRSYMLRDLASLYVANYYEKDAIKSTNGTEDYQAHVIREKLDEKRKSTRSRIRKD